MRLEWILWLLTPWLFCTVSTAPTGYSAAGSRSSVADLRIAESKFIMASVIKSSDADLGIFGTDWVNPAPNLRKNLSLLSPSQVDLAKMLMEPGQIYVFEHWPEPGHEDDQKLTFFEQLMEKILLLVMRTSSNMKRQASGKHKMLLLFLLLVDLGSVLATMESRLLFHQNLARELVSCSYTLNQF